MITHGWLRQLPRFLGNRYRSKTRPLRTGPEPTGLEPADKSTTQKYQFRAHWLAVSAGIQADQAGGWTTTWITSTRRHGEQRLVSSNRCIKTESGSAVVLHPCPGQLRNQARQRRFPAANSSLATRPINREENGHQDVLGASDISMTIVYIHVSTHVPGGVAKQLDDLPLKSARWITADVRPCVRYGHPRRSVRVEYARARLGRPMPFGQHPTPMA